MDNASSMTEQDMINLVETHVNSELQGDLETTMSTMSNNPHLFSIPTMQAAIGYDEVLNFYSRYVPEKFFPKDIEINLVSRTVGNNQLIEENIIKFTHNIEVGWMLPGIDPTEKKVEFPMIVLFKFINSKISHEHLYWDNASVLLQLGLLSPKGLPVFGSDAAKTMKILSCSDDRK
ncbi:MAG: carboxymethylenebutenolidase [Legionellaceae bacterium]|nr:carboxymethylenebutenolidase [Legionellaceae bacterium]